MPLGTLDRRPPPFFHQGPSALTRLAVFSAVALFLMAADTRFAVTRPLRSGLQVLLLPLERALSIPLQLTHAGGGEGCRVPLSRSATLLARMEVGLAIIGPLVSFFSSHAVVIAAAL